MIFRNLFQDPESDSDAPYADALVLDCGGMGVQYAGETIAHVSFEEVDPFELAFHAMPDDWEPYPEWDAKTQKFVATSGELAENAIYYYLNELGVTRGWKRS